MLQATLKVFFAAACVGCMAATASTTTSRAEVLMSLLRAARIRSLPERYELGDAIEAVRANRKTGRRASRLTTLPGFCPAVYPLQLRSRAPAQLGLPLSDQRFVTWRD